MAKDRHAWMDEKLRRFEAEEEARKNAEEMGRKRAGLLRDQGPKLWRELCDELKASIDVWNEKAKAKDPTIHKLTYERGESTFRARTMMTDGRASRVLTGSADFQSATTTWTYQLESLFGQTTVVKNVVKPITADPRTGTVTFSYTVEGLAERLLGHLVEHIGLEK